MGSDNGPLLKRHRLAHYLAYHLFFLACAIFGTGVIKLHTNKKVHTPEKAQAPKKLKKSEEVKAPEKEELYNYKKSYLKKHFGCAEKFKEDLPVHSKETWKKYRDTYVSVVGEAESTIGDPEADFDGFGDISHFAKQSPGKGRGIFAGQDIAQDTLMWNGSRSAQFKDAHSFQKFLFDLEDDYLACDPLQWSYIFDLNKGKGKPDLRIVTDLDEGSFCNNGKSAGNMGYLDVSFEKERPRQNGIRPLFATRDIRKGEEILCSYGEFVANYGWSAFGM
mmetsp:Transcript_36301/g.55496  ORF Transcript_36301/g.55496 Transcript_36301/m.55496 type:complete len:277 (+) Transcript_36301:73-903(+)